MQPNASGVYSGTITTQNVGAPTGNAVTNNSTVTALLDGGFDTASIQVTGVYTGILTVQVTINGTAWITLSGAQSLTSAASGAQSATISSAAQSIYQLDISGFRGVRVTALAAVTGTATVSIVAGIGSGVVGIDTAVSIAAGSQTIGAVTANPATPTSASLVTTASTNAANIKSTVGSLFNVSISNVTATAIYVKLYNKATTPTVGTDIPVITIPVPANSTVNYDIGSVGVRFSAGIGRATTAAIAATDTANAVAGVQILVTYI